MKKNFPGTLSLLLCLSFYSAGAQIVTFSFSGNNGDETTWPSSTTATGVDPSVISRGAGAVAAAHADRFNSTGWTTSNIPDVADYIEFTITPSSGYTINISSIEIHHRRSSAGPRKFIIRTSIDGFTADATTELTIPDINTQQNSTLVLLSQINTTIPITFRMYAYAAETSAGTWGPGEDTGIDLLVYAALSTLPVSFTNLKGYLVNGHAKIAWSNDTESDVAHYVLEHSNNGRTFTQLSIIDPVKNNNSRADYGFEHMHPNNRNYYRIKAVETNGAIMYSAVVKVNRNETVSQITIYSNPVVNSQLKFGINDLIAGKYLLVICNAVGQPVKYMIIKHSGRSFSTTMSVDFLNRGVYFMEIKSTERVHKKLSGKFAFKI